MISRAHRFHGYGSLRYVYRSGRTTRGPLFSVTSVLNPRRQRYRAAVVISRKVHKSAFGRNKMRRQLYEIIRELEPKINQPYDIVLTVFHDTVLKEPHQSLVHQVKKQFREAGILNSK